METCWGADAPGCDFFEDIKSVGSFTTPNSLLHYCCTAEIITKILTPIPCVSARMFAMYGSCLGLMCVCIPNAATQGDESWKKVAVILAAIDRSLGIDLNVAIRSVKQQDGSIKVDSGVVASCRRS